MVRLADGRWSQPVLRGANAQKSGVFSTRTWTVTGPWLAAAAMMPPVEGAGLDTLAAAVDTGVEEDLELFINPFGSGPLSLA